MNYLLAWGLAFGISLALTPVVILLARKLDVIDRPGNPRKIHKQPIPLLGGVAAFLSFFIVLAYFLSSSQVVYQALHQVNGTVLPKNLIGIFIGSLILMISGFLDDKFDLKPRYQLIGPSLAALVVIASGVGITFITNPLGGLLRLDIWRTNFLNLGGLPYRIVWIADIFTFFWLMTIMYTTKVLDGLDGLVSGISAIGALIIFFLSLNIHQPFTALMAVIFFGANLGFLVFNFNPARVFLGEGGSLWSGFMIGIFSIISGGKVATALLIMGVPLLDLAWVTIRRVFKEKNSFSHADRKHIHHRLLEIGLTQRRSVILLYVITAVFGLAALFLQSFGKLVALGLLTATMIVLGSWLIWLSRKRAT